MSQWKRTLAKLIAGKSDANIAFDDACTLLKRAGFSMRQTGGSHRIYTKGEAMLNLQDRDGKIPPYQAKQLREVLRGQIIQ